MGQSVVCICISLGTKIHSMKPKTFLFVLLQVYRGVRSGVQPVAIKVLCEVNDREAAKFAEVLTLRFGTHLLAMRRILHATLLFTGSC